VILSAFLTLAATAIDSATLTLTYFPESRPAAHTGLALAAIDLKLLFKITGLAIATNKISQRGAALFNR
jgi:hypothetical protein